MLRLPLVVLAATTCALSLCATALGAPTGRVTGRDTGRGSWDYTALVRWDLCPEVCDWRINVRDIGDPAKCSRTGVRAPTSDPMSDYDGYRAVGPNIFNDPRPYTANGIELGGYAGVSRLAPQMRRQDHVLCMAAVGLTRADPPPNNGDLAAEQAWTERQRGCVDPREYFPEVQVDTAYRCLRYFPLGSVSFTVRGFTEPPYDPLGLLGPKAGTKGAGGTAASRLSRAEAVRALRRRKVAGTISCKRVGVARQRCRVTRARRTRTFVVTASTAGVRVRRAR